MSRRGPVGGTVASVEGDRVTTLELFFDLAFVFAFTQLSRLMAQEHDALGVLQALVILALLWWSWTSYGWLANLTHADAGYLRVVMLIGMGAMFVAGVVVLEAYRDLPGGLFAPLVFVGAYLVARVTHAVVFSAISEPALRARALLTVSLSVIPSAVLLTSGALLGSPVQVWFGLIAVALEPLVSNRLSSGVAWQVHSTAHFTERHGLVVILALGESIIAIGVGVAESPMSLPILTGIALALLISSALWWAYFSRMARAAERALADTADADRARAARDGYTYLHLVLVAGIVLAALGFEEALAHIDGGEPLGLFTAIALGGGIACFLSGTAFFARRVIGTWSVIRCVAAVLFVALVPVFSSLEAISSLAIVAAGLVAMLIAESLRTRARAAAAPGRVRTARESAAGRSPARETPGG